MMPSGISSNASAEATSLIVPSPPHAITSRAPRPTAALARSRAWPTRFGDEDFGRIAVRVDDRGASCALARAAAGRAPPEIGLMMMAMDIGS